MELNEFIEKFAEAVEIENVNILEANTEFKKLEDWSSLMALSVIAMIDEEYEISIKGEDIRSAVTLADLFETIKSKE